MADADADAGAEAEAGAEVECEGCTCRRASSASSRDASVRSGAACCGAWAWTNEVHATCHMLGVMPGVRSRSTRTCLLRRTPYVRAPAAAPPRG